MSTKLNAEKMAAKRYDGMRDFKAVGYAAAIREVAQPIADERDELREALEEVLAGWELMISAYGYDPAKEPEGSINQNARAILAKHKP